MGVLDVDVTFAFEADGVVVAEAAVVVGEVKGFCGVPGSGLGLEHYGDWIRDFGQSGRRDMSSRRFLSMNGEQRYNTLQALFSWLCKGGVDRKWQSQALRLNELWRAKRREDHAS